MGLHFLHFYGGLVKSFQNGNFVIILLLKSLRTRVPNPLCLHVFHSFLCSYIRVTHTSEEPILGVCSWPSFYIRRTRGSHNLGRTQRIAQQSLWVVVSEGVNGSYYECCSYLNHLSHIRYCASRSGQKIVPERLLGMQLSGQNACLACMRFCV